MIETSLFRGATETTEAAIAEAAKIRKEAYTAYMELTQKAKDAAPSFADKIEAQRAAVSKALKDACGLSIQLSETAISPESRQKAADELNKHCAPAIEEAVQATGQLIDEFQAINDTVSNETTDLAAGTKTLTITALSLASLLMLAGAVFMARRTITNPLSALTNAMQNMSAGRLDIAIEGADRGDEVGLMAKTLEVFRGQLAEVERLRKEQAEQEKRAAQQRKSELIDLANRFQRAVGGIVDTVSSASGQLESAATTLSKTASNTQQLSQAVAAASEQTSANVQGVAAASEQLSSTVTEIGRQVQESTVIASKAVTQASETNKCVTELSEAASRIGDVVNLITTIAGQTNLLALNATIEAARAGDAGKGFAVVAQEVKALASQTEKATNEIGAQISSMQAATEQAVGAIHEIATTINRMSEIAGAIAAAVEEQDATTKEISRNVMEAARGTSEVAANITDVNTGANETGSASSQVLSSAKQLAQESGSLRREVDGFLSSLRAA